VAPTTLATPERRPAIALPVRTAIGKKYVVAASGIIGLGFVLGHMVGNLHAFQGPKQINSYGESLRTLGEPLLPRSLLLWIVRIVLIVAVTLHVVFTVQLARQSRRARPVRYSHTGIVQASYASRTMRWGGAAVFLFIVFHLMDFTWGVHPHFVRGDVYGNLVSGFRRPVVTAVYIVAMACLSAHVYHGTWSTTQTLGLNQVRWDRAIRRVATALAVILFVGFAAVPVGVLVHLVR